MSAPDHRWPLAEARHFADKIMAAVAPFCARQDVAGSIRRQQATCGDVDLVLLPRAGQRAALRERVRRETTLVRDGAENLIVLLANGCQLDIFLAQAPAPDLFGTAAPENYGTLLLCRTGSRAHNIWVASAALRRGWHWDPYRGLFDAQGQWLAGREERDVLDALDLGWIPPEERER
jgi:DNA polymerase/3'-5' exonuclease PolX